MATLQTANANIYAWHGRIPRRMGNISGIQRCGDGRWVSFVLRTGSQETWADMAQWLRDEEIDTPVTAPEWADESFRIARRTEVTRAIAALCAKHDRDCIFHTGQARKQLVMPVNTVEELLVDEQLKHRRFFVTLDDPSTGRRLTDSGLPFRFANGPSFEWQGAPSRAEAAPPAWPLPGTAGGDAPFDPAKPLAGIRVADFAWMIAGPASSRILADYGAEVIKIESQYRVDNIRVVGVQPGGEGSLDTNGVFNDCNTNKLSVRLNVNNPRGRELVKEIIRRSDIVLNNYTAERMPRWGRGYEDLKAIKPDIIMLSMPVMGCTGPYRNYGSYGNGVIAYGGLNMVTGSPDEPPVGLGPLYSDFAAPYLVVQAIMAALYHRQRTGEGNFIDFSQVESTIALLGPAVLRYTTTGTLPPRPGNRSPEAAPHGVFRCAGDDRWCAIAVTSDAEWAAFCVAAGLPELGADPRFATLAARKANEDALEGAVDAWARERDAWQVMHMLQAAGIRAAVVEDLEDMCVRDPWLSREHLLAIPFADEGIEFRTHAQPARMDGRLPPLRRAPRFGEHSREVLERLLGLSEDEVDRLIVDEVVY